MKSPILVFLIVLCLSCVVVQAGQAEEKEYLDKFFVSLQGDSWLTKTGWTSNSTNPCSRFGVYCAPFAGVNRVVTVYLSSNNLRGTIPEGISSLEHLQTLILYNNDIQGTLPLEVFHNLTKIAQVVLSNNRFYGTLHDIVLPPSLNVLEIKSTQLEGTIPESFFGFPCNLGYLWLTQNMFSGLLPELSACHNLKHIDLESNLFTGPIPSSWSNLTFLQNVFLGDNFINGTLEPIAHLSLLSTISAFGNMITSPLPTILGSSTTLSTLVLNVNSFSEQLPSWLNQVSSLKYLDLSSNSFTGGLWMLLDGNRWNSMTFLGLSFNQITGTIPDSFSNLIKLNTLLLSGNKIEATKAPPGFAATSSLKRLYIDSNLFSLDLSSLLTSLANHPLQVLAIDDNLITGPIPPQISSFSQLISFTARGNMITGPIPQAITSIDLTDLDLTNNLMSGEILDNLDIIPLRTLGLTGNDFRHSNSTGVLLPNFATPDLESGFVKNLTGGYSCPQIIGSRRTISIDLDPAYYNWYYCTCDEGFHGRNGSCKRCPDGSKCQGDQVTVDRGMYPFPMEDPQYIYKCPSVSAFDTPCNPSGGFPFKCAEGHEGRFCAGCISGWFRQGMKCQKCDAKNLWLAFVLVSIVTCGCIGVVLWNTKIVTSASENSGSIQILLSYIQNMAVLGLTPIVWANFMRWLLEFHSVSGNISPYGIECMFPDPSSNFLFRFMIPLGLWVVMFLVCQIMGKSKHEIISLSIFLFSVASFYYTTLGAYSWNCKEGAPTENASFLDYFPTVRCGTYTHKIMIVSSIIGIVIYWLVPLVSHIAVILDTLKRQGNDKLERPEFIWMYITFKDNYIWWSLVQYARKTAVALAVGLTPYGSSTLLVLMAFIVVASLIVQSMASPYKNKINNWLELGSLGVLIITYFGGYSLSTSSSESTYYGVSGFLLVINIIYFAIAVYVVFKYSIVNAYKEVKMYLYSKRKPSVELVEITPSQMEETSEVVTMQ